MLIKNSVNLGLGFIQNPPHFVAPLFYSSLHFLSSVSSNASVTGSSPVALGANGASHLQTKLQTYSSFIHVSGYGNKMSALSPDGLYVGSLTAIIADSSKSPAERQDAIVSFVEGLWYGFNRKSPLFQQPTFKLFSRMSCLALFASCSFVKSSTLVDNLSIMLTRRS